MRPDNNNILLTWIARNNDPFEQTRDGSYREDANGNKTIGPTLTLLFDPDSDYKDSFQFIFLFHRDDKKDHKVVKDLKKQIREKDSLIEIRTFIWGGEDPTDHQQIYSFLDKKIQEIRKEFLKSKLFIHISPGTPSMHTIWVLMAKTGMISEPVNLLKSYRKQERSHRSPVVPVEIEFKSFFQAYRDSQPLQNIHEDQDIFWNPQQFKSERLSSLFKQAHAYAQMKIPVIILGERGTGKTTLASWIRANSPWCNTKKDSPWPVIACGQYSGETLRAELMGYKKGAFTGADKDRAGLLASAHEDTLFLDEIADMGKDLQRMVIRTLEEKKYTCLGGVEPEESDFRLITATNRDWRELEKRLDADFLDRISYLRLTMPSLREIPEEIPWLWEEVFQKAIDRSSLQEFDKTSVPHQQIVNKLREYPLSGNIRDLFQVAYQWIAGTLEGKIEEELMKLSFQNLEKKKSSNTNQTYEVCEAFLHNTPLDGVVKKYQPIQTKTILKPVQVYLASEIKRIAKIKKIQVKELCDSSTRGLDKRLEGKK
jgi:DNA-binding NtrC family response regulator